MKKVLILFGGSSSEHYISCKSAKSVIENIDDKLFTYEIAGISLDGIWYKFSDDLSYLQDGNWLDGNILKIDNIINYLKSFDVVFPVTHGTFCEDGKLQGMLELFGIKFVGCKTLTSAIGMDKGIFKLILESLKIPQVPYLVVNKNYKTDEIINKIGFPLIVKPANGGSSIGISKVNSKQELVKAIKNARKYDNKIIIEKFIIARELEIAILEDEKNLICSMPGEIKSANEFYDYNAKYINSDSNIFIPAVLPDNIIVKIKNMAVNVFESLGCNGYTRLDFFYDDHNGDIFINEINTIPGFTSISMYPKLLEKEGISYKQLITKLINSAK